MDAQQFLAEFGYIASAPGGVGSLRALILNMAVSGKLTLQNDNEHSALLIDKIAIKRDRLLGNGNIKKNKKLRNEEIKQPWILPLNWQWTRFADLCSFSAGRTPSRKECRYWNTGDYPWFSIADLDHGQYVKKSSETISQIAQNEVFKKPPVPAGTLLMSFKLSIGKLSILGVDAYHNEAIIAIQPFAEILNDYFFRCLSGFDLTAGNKAAIKGDTLNQDSLSNILIALPPEEEISRIVAKVDELMTLCEKLEAQQQERQKLKKLVRATTLDAFVTASNPVELKQSWLRLEKGLEFWGDDERAPFELRNAIGAIACRGLLTDSGVLQPVTNNDTLPPLPEGWRWQTLGELSTHITSGSRGWKQYLATTGEIFIRSQDIKRDAVFFEDPAYVLLPEKSEGKRTLVQTGDLLLTITGGNVGKCAQVPELPKPAYVSQHVALIRIEDPESTPFIHFWMTNIHGGRKFLSRYIYGDKPGLNLTQVASVPVPMPPKAIQSQIADSLEQYTTICNRLLQQVTEANKTAGLLAIAAVASINGISADVGELPQYNQLDS